jgi:hypothetical protein
LRTIGCAVTVASLTVSHPLVTFLAAGEREIVACNKQKLNEKKKSNASRLSFISLRRLLNIWVPLNAL